MSQSIANEIQIESRERRPLRLDDILMNRWFLHTVSVSLFLGLWYWTVYMDVFGRGLCYPHEVLQEIGNLMTRRLAGKGLWDHAWDSTRRVFIGFGIACALGIPLGFFMGINKYFNAFFNPIFNLIKPMPPISWVSLSILWLGIGEEPKIFIIAIGAFVPIVLNAYNGIRLIDEELYDVVRMAGGGRMKEIRGSLLPRRRAVHLRRAANFPERGVELRARRRTRQRPLGPRFRHRAGHELGQGVHGHRRDAAHRAHRLALFLRHRLPRKEDLPVAPGDHVAPRRRERICHARSQNPV